MIDTRPLIAAVRKVAAAEILPLFRNIPSGEVDRKSGEDDLVTVADRAAEAALTQAFHAAYPDATIIGEEAVSADKSVLDGLSDPFTIIIDPIDGTWNYANGIGIFGVLIAVVAHGQTQFGMLYDPLGDDWVEATRGAGAWFVKGDTRRRLTLSDRPQTAAMAAGNVQLNTYQGADRAVIAATISDQRRLVMPGCSCHEYRMLAQGQIDFALSRMLNPWDHAAGALALTEAGGVVRLLDGRDYVPTLTSGLSLAATSEALWHERATVYRAALGRSTP